ncbi:hypothetical protein RUM44_002093 [Polyplax serrata]|uniref:Uncharacterized protein n=1 Tax=Polyplax serrata TaxID=468196 RepID=A0ABR1ALX7_POLSC
MKESTLRSNVGPIVGTIAWDRDRPGLAEDRSPGWQNTAGGSSISLNYSFSRLGTIIVCETIPEMEIGWRGHCHLVNCQSDRVRGDKHLTVSSTSRIRRGHINGLKRPKDSNAVVGRKEGKHESGTRNETRYRQYQYNSFARGCWRAKTGLVPQKTEMEETKKSLPWNGVRPQNQTDNWGKSIRFGFRIRDDAEWRSFVGEWSRRLQVVSRPSTAAQLVIVIVVIMRRLFSVPEMLVVPYNDDEAGASDRKRERERETEGEKEVRTQPIIVTKLLEY